MGMLSSAETRRSLVERGLGRLSGQGISRAEVEKALVRLRRDLVSYFDLADA